MVAITEDHLSPPEPPTDYAPDDERCSDCGHGAEWLGEPVSECEGFEGDCGHDARYCDHCSPLTEDGETRCPGCEAKYVNAMDMYVLGLREAPLAERDLDCAACGKWAHAVTTPGTWCDDCGHVTCGDCQHVGMDRLVRCEPCAKAMVGL